MTSTRWHWAAITVLVLALVWSLRSGAANDQQAHDAGERADSIQKLRLQDQARATADSAALVTARASKDTLDAQIAQERARAHRLAARATASADSAAGRLRTTLDSLRAPTGDLDRLVLAQAAVVAQKDREIVQADSATAVERSLRMVTERALASRNDAYFKLLPESEALRVQVGALKRARSRDRMATALVVVAVVAAVVVTH